MFTHVRLEVLVLLLSPTIFLVSHPSYPTLPHTDPHLLNILQTLANIYPEISLD